MAVLKYWDGTTWQSIGAGVVWSPGDLKMTMRTTADAGWLICDGSLKSQATYPALFEAIGHSANNGTDPGGGNFKLPDLRSRIPLGKGAGATIGATGGSNDAVVVSHSHTQNAHTHIQNGHGHTQDAHDHAVSDPGHEHAIDGDYGNRVVVSAAGAQANSLAGAADPGNTFSDIDANTTGIDIAPAQPNVNSFTATNQDATATNQAFGSSATDANMQAYQVCNYVIKT